MIDNLSGDGGDGKRAGGAKRCRSDRLDTRVHGVIITPWNLVISTLFLSLRVEFLALDLVGAEVREVHEGFNKLEEDESSVSKGDQLESPV